MKNRTILSPALLSVALVFSLIVPVLLLNTASVVAQGPVTPMVDAGEAHTAGLKKDGTVVAVGNNEEGQRNVVGWTDIIQVAAGDAYTVGLKSDGTLVAVGNNAFGQRNVVGWTDIIQVAAGGFYHTVGLKSDGTVIAVGADADGQCKQCNVGNWTDIVQVAAGETHTLGLKTNGTVVAVGANYYGQCDVGNWTDIVQVDADHYHTAGVKSDGTVVAVGDNDEGQCNVGGWTDIVQVAAGETHTVGLKKDGTVVAVGSNSSGQCDVGSWTDIIQVAAGYGHTVGLKDDGTVVAVGSNSRGQCNASHWNLVLAVPAPQYVLTISSTAGGNVTAPGEGTFTYTPKTVVDIVAEPEEGYRFARWTGDIDTIADITASVTNITMQGDYSVTANFVSGEAGNVSIRAGDWIKLAYRITGWPAGQPYPEWLKLEFLSVEGTSTNVQVTMHMSDGSEQSDTMPVDLAAGGGEGFGLSGFVIPANLTTADSVYMSGFGDVTIRGETTRTYAGARRTAVYTSISQSIPYQGEVKLTYYWDKLTGIMVEAATTFGSMSATCKVAETNMWEAGSSAVGMPWWVWVIVGAAVVALAIAVYRLKKRKTPTTPTPPGESA